MGRAELPRREWTTGEVRQLLDLRRRRASVRTIASRIGRTEAAIWSFLRDYPDREAKRRPPPPSKPQPPSPSDRLRDATLRAILQHARKARVDVDTAARKLLSEGVEA